YKWQNVKSQAYLVYTNKAPTGAFRGFGNPSASWAVEQALDIAGEKLGIDPIELMRKNACEPGYVSPHGNRVISCELRQCIDRASELFGWEEKRRDRRPYRGVGATASADARDQILGLAAEMREARAGDLEIQDGRIFVRGAPEGRSTTVAEVANKTLFRRKGTAILGKGEFDSDTEHHDPKERYGNESG